MCRRSNWDSLMTQRLLSAPNIYIVIVADCTTSSCRVFLYSHSLGRSMLTTMTLIGFDDATRGNFRFSQLFRHFFCSLLLIWVNRIDSSKIDGSIDVSHWVWLIDSVLSLQNAHCSVLHGSRIIAVREEANIRHAIPIQIVHFTVPNTWTRGPCGNTNEFHFSIYF